MIVEPTMTEIENIDLFRVIVNGEDQDFEKFKLDC